MLLLSLYCKAKALVATRDRGASASEYALIVFAVISVVAATIFVFGNRIEAMFNGACNAIQATGC
jgi:pilus assembly protein Flp/PilA